MKLSALSKVLRTTQKVGIWTQDGYIFSGYLREYSGKDYDVDRRNL